MVVGDLLFAYLSLDETYQTGRLPDALYMTAQFLFALAAYRQVQRTAVPAEARDDAEGGAGTVRWLPYAAVAAGYGVLLYMARETLTRPLSALLFGAVVLTALVVVRQILVLRDNARHIAERRALVAQLRHQAFHDSLTGLPNRALFVEHLHQAVEQKGDRTGRVAVLFLDLDGFKVINDSLGHSAGDDLLLMIGKRIRDLLQPSDTVARFGGDEFTILLSDLSHPYEALEKAEEIRAALSVPLFIHGQEIVIGVSVGVATNVLHMDGPDMLLRRADIALYEAKTKGKRQTVHFESTMQTRAIERLQLAADLRRAVAHGELRLYYQPEIDLRNGAVVGVEALLRWQHPTRGLLDPDSFIPMAEESGLIVSIGAWVLENACRQARAWDSLRPDGPPLVMSVNLSARQFVQPELVRQIAGLLHETGLNPSQLQLELTESLLMAGDEPTVQTIHALNLLGVQLAIDDFGAGYTSLRYLQTFSVDLLKIDRTLVQGLGGDPRGVAIVRALTTAAHSLGMDVTAEGIETAEQAAETRRAGCDRGQGYLFAGPLPSEEVKAFLGPAYRAVVAPIAATHEQ